MPSSKKPSPKLDRLSNRKSKKGASERILSVLRDKLRRGEVPEGEFSLRKPQGEDNRQDS